MLSGMAPRYRVVLFSCLMVFGLSACKFSKKSAATGGVSSDGSSGEGESSISATVDDSEESAILTPGNSKGSNPNSRAPSFTPGNTTGDVVRGVAPNPPPPPAPSPSSPSSPAPAPSPSPSAPPSAGSPPPPPAPAPAPTPRGKRVMGGGISG